jgi:hypothetical protein
MARVPASLSYTEHVLKILEKSYGTDNPRTKTVAANLEQIKKANRH